MRLNYRAATLADLPTLVKLLAEDPLGATREAPKLPLHHAYLAAFEAIEKDLNNQLTVVESHGDIVAVLQLTFIPYLNRLGTWRCLIEGVRVHKNHRGQGVGQQIFRWAIEQARQKGCGMVQLTSDKQRPDALRFYEQLGFVASHEGFKLTL